jgi:ComF family protein
MPSSFYRTGAAFAYEGPAASLAKGLKYRNQPYLAKGMAAYLVIQWGRLQWPLPDAIIPIPLSFSRWIERGYNQSQLLAHEMGELLQCPVVSPLKKKSGTFTQAALPLEHRKLLTAQQFTCTSSSLPLENKTLLLLDDVATTGATLHACAEVLQQKGANKLYALTFCRTFTHANDLVMN